MNTILGKSFKMSRQTTIKRVRCYIDGFNLYHAIDGLGKDEIKWLNMRTLAESFLKDDEMLDRVYFFTAILKWDQAKQQRHVSYIKALRAMGVDVIESTFKKGSRYCFEQQRFCKNREEKQTDVAIALGLVGDAYEDKYDRAILITADSDQIPAVELVQSRFPQKQLSLAAPPKRMSEARDLGSRFTDRREITEGRLRTCLLPYNVYDQQNRLVASIPTKYLTGHRYPK